MRCLADFLLSSDLRLPDDAAPLSLRGPEGVFIELRLSNAEANESIPNAVLSAQLIFDADAFSEKLRDHAMDKLAAALNCLTYATNRKFVRKRLKRIIDWTPGIIEREAIIYTETPEWDVAEPVFDAAFMDTTERLLAMQSGDDQRAAMRWYRLAIQAEVPEEQFSYFWFSLEIAADTLKGTEKVPSKCPRCRAPLYCENCKNHPIHRRYPGEAIQQVIERVHPTNAEEIFQVLQKIRHTLMHGGQIASLRGELPCDEEKAINKLAFVTWHAIGLMFGNPDPRPDAPLNFGYTDNLVRRTVVAGVRLRTTLLPGGDPNSPTLADFPAVDFKEVT